MSWGLTPASLHSGAKNDEETVYCSRDDKVGLLSPVA